MWELGFSTAIGKRFIVLCERGDALPFNVSTTDIVLYDFSHDGMEALRSELVNRLRVAAPQAQLRKDSLIVHEEFETASRQVMSTLKKISQNSLLERLALKELERIGERFDNLGKGLFVLRNVKPYDEIIDYYCAYLSQLRGEDCGFDVVSNLNFWDEITERGDDYRYLDANLAAVRNGAHIRRVILIDSRAFPEENLSGNEVYQKILQKFAEAGEGTGKLETRLLFSNSYAAELRSLSNFGILRKGTEVLLFKPDYDDRNRMRKTRFLYRDNSDPRMTAADKWQGDIAQYEVTFSGAWDRAANLSEEHYR
jgi:hypothetical protein